MMDPVKSRQRIIDHGEVFTPPTLVNDMLDLVAHECERIDSRFLEPACGDGNFLAEVLRRKLLTVDKKHARNRERWERDAILSLCSLYGIDLLPDNIAACRERLLKVITEAHAARFMAPLSEAEPAPRPTSFPKTSCRATPSRFAPWATGRSFSPNGPRSTAHCSNAATSPTTICSTTPTCRTCRFSATWGKMFSCPRRSASSPRATI